MTVHGSLGQWRRWTGQPFDRDGLVAVPGGLAPVLVSQARGLGVYVEPNVWVRHDVREAAGLAGPPVNRSRSPA